MSYKNQIIGVKKKTPFYRCAEPRQTKFLSLRGNGLS